METNTFLKNKLHRLGDNGLGINGEIVEKGYKVGDKYYKRTHVSFVMPAEILVDDELLHRLYFYVENLKEVKDFRRIKRQKIDIEIYEIEKFLKQYSK